MCKGFFNIMNLERYLRQNFKCIQNGTKQNMRNGNKLFYRYSKDDSGNKS